MSFGGYASIGGSQHKDNTLNAISRNGDGAFLTAGVLAVVFAVTDNVGTTDITSGGTEHNLADSKLNAWVKAIEARNGNGAAAAGETTSVWLSLLSSTIDGADTITLTVGSGITAKAIYVHRFTVGAGVTIQVDAAVAVNADGSLSPSATLSGLANVEHLFLGVVGFEGPPADTIAVDDLDYTSVTHIGTSGGSAVTNVTVDGAYRIATLTGDTYAPTLGGSRDHTAILVALSEVASVSPLPAVNVSFAVHRAATY